MHKRNSDINAWAIEQASLLRNRQYDALDVHGIADEIEDVGKSEQRELANRMAVLIAHLLKWVYQPDRRGASWQATIRAQRKEIMYGLGESPSLKPKLADALWVDMVWSKAMAQAISETGLDCFPTACPWDLTSQILNDLWWPDSSGI